MFEEGDLLVSKLQPDKGKVVTVGKDYAGCVGSSELVPLVINSDEVTLDYLWAVLRSNYILRQWEYELSGSSRMRIGRSEIINTIVPVPDKDIQNKIVKEVKDKMSRAQKALEESKKLSELAKERFLKLLLNRKVD